MKNLFKCFIAFLAISIGFTSCKKDSEDNAPSIANKTTAVVSTIGSGIINGHWGNPSTGPGSFGTIYINLASGVIDTASTLSASHDIAFTSFNNTFVQGVNGYTVSYVQGATWSFANITTTTPTTPSATGGIGQSTATSSPFNGWYTYTPPGAAYNVVPNFFIIVKKAGAPTYAIRFTSLVGEGGPTSNRAVFGIEYGSVAP